VDHHPYTTDGAHPSTTGHQAIAAAVNLASLTL
jgi:lysophospholipase L1-like esterase